MYHYVMGISLCLCACVCSGQDCGHVLRVRVKDARTSEPVFAATVFIEPLQRSYAADDSGNIRADNICGGRYVLHTYAAGYQPATDTVAAAGDAATVVLMTPLHHTLQQARVTGTRTTEPLQATERMDRAAIAQHGGETLAGMLEAVNGVTMLANGATIGKPVIHGLHSNRIALVNNGIRQEDQQWGGEHAPDIDPYAAGSITVVKGAAGARYGTEAIGGVVLIEPAPLRSTPGWNGTIDAAGFWNNRMGVVSSMVEHAFRKLPLSFRLQGTLKKGGNYRIPGYRVANTGVEENDYAGTVVYRRERYGAEMYYSHFQTDIGIYRGSHTGSAADLMNAINSNAPLVPAAFTYRLGRPRQHVVHDLLKTKVYADTRPGMWTLTYSYQHNYRQEYDVLRTENGKAQLNLTLNTQSLNINLDHKQLKGISGQVGADGVYQHNFFRDGDRLFIPTYTSLAGAGYVIERYRRHSYTIETGLRYDYHWYGVYNPEGSNQHIVYYEFNYSNFSGTLGFRQQLKANWQWSATVANAWRAPQANELFSAGLHHGAARIEIGNKYLLPERAHSLNMETKYVWRKRLTAEVSLYSQMIDDYIYLSPGPDLLTIRGYFKTFDYKQTNAWLNGADASLRYQWNKRLETNLKGSILRARDRSRHDWLILMPADRIALNTRYTRRISDVLSECFTEVGIKYVFEQTRIPRDFDQVDYPRPPKGYLLADAAIGASIAVRKQPMQVSLSVTNMLNAKYRDYMDVFRYFIDQQGTNVILRLHIPFNLKTSKN